MYIHLGRDYVLNDRDIIGIFNLETTTVSPRGREFLNYAQKNGAVVSLSAHKNSYSVSVFQSQRQHQCD